jgi:hypothetical protein
MTQTRSAARRPIVAAVLSGAGLVAGIGAFSTAPQAAAATASPAAMAAAPHQCRANDLRVTVTRGSSGTGHTWYTIRFTNLSSSACTLYGYPGVSAIKHLGGQRIGKAAARDHQVHSGRVTIAPGGKAHAYLTVIHTDRLPASCNPATGHWLRVYAPGQTAPQVAHRAVSVCTDGTRNMSVRPVRPGRGQQN